jgi:DNA-binding NarL/FixJ family response regulator
VIRLLIFEDNLRLAESLTELLNETGDICVVAHFTDGKEALKRIRLHQPDVVLMDIDMPGSGGLDALRTIRREDEKVNILMYTVFDDNSNVFQAICEGANGYLLKKADPEKVIAAIHEVFNGGAPMTPSIARKVLQLFSAPYQQTKDLENLSAREHEVLKILVRGSNYKMIAAELNISQDTVSSHVKNIYRKLHVNSKSQAVAKAIHNRLI